MQIHKGLQHLPNFKNAVLTIGTYDGVHFGHQQIIKRLNDIAAEINGESILLTFDPHPRLILNPNDNKLKLISTIDEKEELLEKYGLNHLVIVEFSKEFASMEADEYVEKILINNFHPKKIIIGYDHRFGKNRKGNIDLLRQLSTKYNYEVEEIPAQTLDEISVSSTKVRTALLEGDIIQANEFLAHPFTIKGNVIHGDKIGRILGFPTANIEVSNPHKLIPASGVYAVKIKIKDTYYKGALSIGYRETVFDNSKLTIEVFIIDFDGDLYNQQLDMIFLDYIRPQIKYENWDLLKEQIEKDVEFIQQISI
ncbi:MAG TPA: bifunctional riboflavin kinase/FAD synthetase [Chitinophagales bacterium]|jgi:riboflavin kinase/FMN adenylyltransferase|nr:bifunctional riboflavin kinase/FAD synthetase [Chitinophagales bacterium]HQV77349.1 bifunctional riboflavin kinase/FAD synthetase [Chitinophagales bacterium]HQW78411.1 bifunctional riboflavin kinase/FAD synthetase [Chitinophagales bacterium]HRB18809.1 bifunctional riboflavin kinase/FAD synthetase [Chitinophagales bacterium]HRB66853.1 bifunctional riboflavin kinase/FAD synthetase [Chitinophagales bacterium]